ncbi:MAG TPA: hypothetical protein VJ821_09380 [Anaerolineales bacterium]|nr:hypothetical protein [Anaerolineales bacterium]
MPAQVRAFFVSLLQVFLLTAAMIALVFAAIGPDPTHYFAGSLLQLELIKNTSGPRIILVGGSNVSFGLDAELMQRTLSVPVINDGLHAGLGIVPLRELQEYLRSGDIVIISLEYTMFSSESIMEGDRAFLSDWIEYSPHRIRFLSDPWWQAPSLFATMLQRKVNRTVNTYLFGGSLDEERSVFAGTKYNANGDFVGHLNEPSMARRKIPDVPYSVWHVQEEIFIFLEHFHQTAREKGAQVYFAAPASRKTNCENTGEASMANFFKTFEDRSSIPVLTPLEEVCLPDKYFFDTAYHLNADGRRLRTERLIGNWMKLTASAK